MAIQETALAPTRSLPTWSARTSFALVIACQVVLFAGSNLPTPLFPVYEHRFGFGAGVVTLLFSSYVAVLIPALAMLGPVADRVGRRPLLVGGLALTTVSSAAFAAARSVGWLFAGEVLYGLGSALVMSCVSIVIRELHPRQHVVAASLAASVAMAAGMTVGPLVSGLLAEVTPWPTTAPYVLDIVLAALLATALSGIPETRPTGATASARVRALHVPAEIRSAFAGPAAAGAATFMVTGWVFGLSPSFLHDELHVHLTRPLVAALFAALVVFTTGGSQLVLRRAHGPRPTKLALLTVVAGMGLIATSSVLDSLAVMIAGGLLAGVGSGVVQMNAMTAVQRMAPLHARSSVMSTYATCCYVAISVPVIVAGQAADRFGLAVVTTWYFAALVVAVAVTQFLLRRSDAWSAS